MIEANSDTAVLPGLGPAAERAFEAHASLGWTARVATALAAPRPPPTPAELSEALAAGGCAVSPALAEAIRRVASPHPSPLPCHRGGDDSGGAAGRRGRGAGAAVTPSVQWHVLSDANDVFIRSVLARAPGGGLFPTSVISNPLTWEGGEGEGLGRGQCPSSPPPLPTLRPRRSATDPHGCPRCPPNLCKGVEALAVAAAAPRGAAFVVAGDGANDVCPCLSLHAAGHSIEALARDRYPERPDGGAARKRSTPRMLSELRAAGFGAATPAASASAGGAGSAPGTARLTTWTTPEDLAMGLVAAVERAREG